MVEGVGVHLDLLVDVGGPVVGGEVAEGFEESLLGAGVWFSGGFQGMILGLRGEREGSVRLA